MGDGVNEEQRAVGTPPVDEEWVRRMRGALDAELTPRRRELRRLGDAVRLVIERLVATDAPTEELTRAAGALEALATTFEPYPQGRLYEGFAEAANAGTDQAFFDHSPIMGLANPLAPPAILRHEDGMVVGTVRFGSAYEGPPGCVHGGYVAATFDELLGMTQSLSGNPGMTGTLTVRYRRPTPLHRDLRLEGELLGVEGRKIFTRGRCFAGDDLTAEADGIFVSVDLNRIAQLYAARHEEKRPPGSR